MCSQGEQRIDGKIKIIILKMLLSTFENLPNEILMQIFQSFADIYLLFRTFFGLNHRLNCILLDKRSHLFTDFLHVDKHDRNFHAYYNSLVFQTVSGDMLSMHMNVNEYQLDRCFQSLISFHIREQYIQMKCQVELSIQKVESIREGLTDEDIFHVNQDLRKAFEDLRKPLHISLIEHIKLLVYKQGARLEYNDHEQAGFYFAEDFCDLFFSHIDHHSFLQILPIFKILFISNSQLLNYPCYGAGYRFHIYEFLLYYHYHHRTHSLNGKDCRALVDLILFSTQCQNYLSNGDNWMEKIILMILDVLAKNQLINKLDIFTQTAQIEILRILLEEYGLREDLSDRIRYLLDRLMKINRLDVILMLYRYYKPFREFFNNPMNIRKNVNMMTGNRMRKELFWQLIEENPLESWLIDENLIFILLEKKERKLLEKLIKSSLVLLHRLDSNGNTLLLYICLHVSGCRHRIIEFLMKMGCDPLRRNSNGQNFYDALQLQRNRKLLRSLTKQKSVQIDGISE